MPRIGAIHAAAARPAVLRPRRGLDGILMTATLRPRAGRKNRLEEAGPEEGWDRKG